MKTTIILVAALLCISPAGHAVTRTLTITAIPAFSTCGLKTHARRDTPPTASEVVKEACAEAAAGHKKVMILFHASWCKWCHKLDTLMASPGCKSLFDRAYVIRHLTIAESPAKKNLENPGAQELYEKYADANAGIPFFLILSPDGKVIADSRIKPVGAKPGSSGVNIGYPASKEEIGYFLRVLHETTSLTTAQLRTIREKLRTPA